MDTGSGNEKLNSYYVGCGFRYLGITQLNNTDGLPDHYKAGSSSLFEIDIEDSDLKELPEDLMPPVNDGACSHLPGVIIPNLSLWTTEGKKVLLSNLQGLLVIYCYPMTGAPDIVLPEGWDAIHGARGCTPQACSFRDHYSQLRELNAAVYGISTQSTEILKNEKARIHLPFELISDQDLCFAKALKLPVFEVEGTSYLKRVTLIFSEGKIITALNLGYMCSSQHLSFLKKWFRQDEKSMEELQRCSKRAVDPISDKFNYILLISKGETLTITYEAKGRNLDDLRGWRWIKETVFQPIGNNGIKVAKWQNLDFQRYKF